MTCRSILAAVSLLIAAGAFAAPRPDRWARWEAHDPGSTTGIDHSAWDAFLKTYLVTDHPSGITRVRYGSVSAADKTSLDDYVSGLAAVAVSGLDRAEQKAYWVNLYNALTVQVILDHYPVESIRDIKSGLFAAGPWDRKLLTVEGESITLNDIEHRILRPIWQDPRVHYAVNCASLGCPNLQPAGYTAENTERLLEKGAREYVNHTRGVRVEPSRLYLSSIYDWFQVDFGGSEEGVIAHVTKYAEPPLADALREFDGKTKYEYDWNLNE